MTIHLTRRKFLVSAAATGAALVCQRLAAAEEAGERAWDAIREHLFQQREILPGHNVVKVIAPVRPPNSGDVTVRIESLFPQSAERFVKKHHLVIDENPSPVAGVFTLSPQSGLANVATRIRVNAYSDVRAITEISDGSLYMDSMLVKASGGCSSPPMKSDPLMKLTMGKTTLIDEGKTAAGPHKFHVSVIHPSYSGLQKDQLTHLFIPPHYVENVEVRNREGETVFAASGDISFSENPSFGFHYTPRADDVLSVKVTDSRKKVFESQWPVLSA